MSYGPAGTTVDNLEYRRMSLHNDRPISPRCGQLGWTDARARAYDLSTPHIAEGPLIAQGDALTKVISIANQKGGVGKTTCSINLGGALAERGYRVLCVDMDPQANMTVGLGVSLSDVRESMADVLSEDRVSLDDVVRTTQADGLWVAPATLELASTEVELFTAIGREMVLRDALSGWAEQQ
ncbi:MAG: AAA family ATPase, partial [Chloroflexota bacterium]|nr:AAA family ATPase [Chloroflexota bacterium]